MSAILKEEQPRLAPMRDADLTQVLAIENEVYTHPWTRGNFTDSILSGYHCWTWRREQTLIGYFVLMVAAGEGHLLNLSVAAAEQRRGHGSALLREILRLARKGGAQQVFLEVRPTNLGARAMYRKFGFRQIAVRPAYYPAHKGREDALVFSIAL
jgi:ribosomal-protein-alanine N-acetyltransferase